MRPLSVRVKLMLLYLLVTLAGLGLFGLMSFGALRYATLEGKKAHLVGREQRLITLMAENKANHVPTSFENQLRDYALITHEGNLFHLYNADGSLFFPSDFKSSNWLPP